MCVVPFLYLCSLSYPSCHFMLLVGSPRLFSYAFVHYFWRAVRMECRLPCVVLRTANPRGPSSHVPNICCLGSWPLSLCLASHFHIYIHIYANHAYTHVCISALTCNKCRWCSLFIYSCFCNQYLGAGSILLKAKDTTHSSALTCEFTLFCASRFTVLR